MRTTMIYSVEIYNNALKVIENVVTGFSEEETRNW